MRTAFSQRQLKEGARVTRYAPSPTGFMHIGNLFGLYKRAGGSHYRRRFYVRIEDTDKKREVEGGVSGILRDLAAFGCTVDEGVISETEEKGEYGPYRQSNRREIYHVFAKSLVEKGFAYPCFLLGRDPRRGQKAAGGRKRPRDITRGHARCRGLCFDEIRKISRRESLMCSVCVRGQRGRQGLFDDMIKGKIEMPEKHPGHRSSQDRRNPHLSFRPRRGRSSYGNYHVVRGDEWIASAPVHLQLFAARI